MEKHLRAKVNMLKPTHFLGFGFGSGLIPFMPGTMGSLAAIPLILLMSLLPLWAYLMITLVSCVLGVVICQKVSDDLDVHDHGAIVWDEIAGMMIVFIALPITWQSVLFGFILFRILDIVKPWPIRYFDKNVQGGWGIMVDDLIAGAIVLVVMQLYYAYLADLLPV